MIHERALASPAKEHPMATRLPASQRTREELTALIEGRLSTASAKDELVKLATRLIVEEALEGEAGDTIGRAAIIKYRTQNLLGFVQTRLPRYPLQAILR